MDANTTELNTRFPELKDPEMTIMRLAEAFVAPEYARAAFGMMRNLINRYRDTIRFGQTTVVTAPYDYEPIFLTIGNWWFFSFHTASVEELEAGEDVEPIVPLDYPEVLRRQREELIEDEEERAEEGDAADDSDDDEDDDDDEVYEATFYQVGTFLLDSTIIPHETIFEREDLDCYAYDYPEERIEAERFYWARMVWEPEDLANEDLLAAINSAAEFLIANHSEAPYAEYHDSDFAQLVLDEALCERAIGAADFGDVIHIEADTNGE
jgi:hypothetical protein